MRVPVALHPHQHLTLLVARLDACLCVREKENWFYVVMTKFVITNSIIFPYAKQGILLASVGSGFYLDFSGRVHASSKRTLVDSLCVFL